MTATSQIDQDLIRELIDHHRAADPDMAEANVAEVFVARFFEALGWNTKDPLVWNRQAFVRGAGFADAALQIGGEPVLFVEVKRFKGVVRRQTEVTVEQTLYGEAPILSQAEREALNIDRTPEEKQAMRYARRAGIRWAVLTNFERLLLFNADEERVVLAFDMPDAYLARLDDLALLGPAETRAQFHSRLQWYADLQQKPEIDEDFYRFLSEWRIELAQQIYDHNWRGEVLPVGGEETYAHLAEPPLTAAPGMGEPPRHLLEAPDGAPDLDRLRQAVQRTLDRLILLRYADDVGFLAQHDLLESQLIAFMQRQLYVNEYELQQDLNRLYWAFYRQHDTSIFTPGALCERLRIPNQTLIDLIQAINAISFRKFSGDILGNTYESYLGQRLVLDEQAGEETIRVEGDRALRKESGIYYTPSYIVRYIVDHTLGRWLYGTANGRPDGEPLPSASPKSIADLTGLRVVDPAMGSGSFLIYAFEVLAEFYERENARIEAENAARWNAWSEQAMKEGMFGRDNDVPELEQPARDYVGRILQEHLYGVDLDPEAAEIASVNLILRAFDRLRGESERQKLPLVLGQNLKVGNSLISGSMPSSSEGEGPGGGSFRAERRQLIARRVELRDLTGDTARAQKLAEIAEIAAPVNAALNASLAEHFDEIAAKRPFNWEIEFPEVFDPDAPEEARGFTFVIGNPPYVRVQNMAREDKDFLSDSYETPYYNYDIYIPFVERSVELLRQRGDLGFILPNKFFQLRYGTKLRQKLANEKLVSTIVDFGSNQLFQGQTTYTCLLFLTRMENQTFDYFEVPAVSPINTEMPRLLQQTTKPGCKFKARLKSNRFSGDVWVFAAGIAADILRKAERNTEQLGNLAQRIIVGIQTSADDIYILERLGKTNRGMIQVYSAASDECREMESDLLKPLVSGAEIARYKSISTKKLLLFPYRVGEDGAELISVENMRCLPHTWSYLKEHEEQLRGRENGKFDRDDWYVFGRHQNLDKQEFSKLVIPRLVERLSFTYDAQGQFYLDNVDVNGVILEDDTNPWYLLAVLNSRLIDFIFKKGSVPFRGDWYSANRQFIEVLPIRVIDDENPAEVAAHDELAALAQRMLDLNAAHQAVRDAFAEAVRGYERTATALAHFVAEQRDFIARRPLIDANDEGEVSAIRISEAANERMIESAEGRGGGLVISAQIAGEWRDVVQLEIEREDLRLYLLLALRAFLYEHRRKYVWSRGKILRGVLEALEVPRLAAATVETHQRRVAEVLDDARRLLPDELPHHDVGLDRAQAPLHLSALEAELSAADADIDRRVYALYGLTEQEIAVVEGE